MIPLGILASSQATSESAATVSLRYYFAGDVPIGTFPWQQTGQAELLKVLVVKPQNVDLK